MSFSFSFIWLALSLPSVRLVVSALFLYCWKSLVLVLVLLYSEFVLFLIAVISRLLVWRIFKKLQTQHVWRQLTHSHGDSQQCIYASVLNLHHRYIVAENPAL